MKKICITGGNGLLGVKLIAEGYGEYSLVSIDVQEYPLAKFEDLKYIQGDITDTKGIFNILKNERPDCLINTAAFTDVDGCESEKDKAWEVNVDGAKNVAVACETLGIKMIHLSSDYVFDGKDGPYDESEEPNPISFYGKTKWESEKQVSGLLNDVVIARTTVLYGFFLGIRKNFVTWTIDQLKNRKNISIVGDQYGTPTLADDLARALLILFKKNNKGLYNTVGNELINRYDFAHKIAEIFGLDSSLIQLTTSDRFKQPAPRPLKGGLKIDKIRRETGFEFSSVYEGLEVVRQQMTCSL